MSCGKILPRSGNTVCVQDFGDLARVAAPDSQRKYSPDYLCGLWVSHQLVPLCRMECEAVGGKPAHILTLLHTLDFR